LQLWSVADAAHARLLFAKNLPDANLISWSPCGRYLALATLSPRLRVNNLLAIVALVRDKSTGAVSFRLVFQWVPENPNIQLSEVIWAKVAAGSSSPTKGGVSDSLGWDVPSPSVEALLNRPTPPLITVLSAVSGGQSNAVNSRNQPQEPVPQPAAAYVPPSLRNRGVSESQSKPANSHSAKRRPSHHRVSVSEADSREKRIRALEKKLADIDKLKEKKAEGVQLELNQVAKIESEAALRAEIVKIQQQA